MQVMRSKGYIIDHQLGKQDLLQLCEESIVLTTKQRGEMGGRGRGKDGCLLSGLLFFIGSWSEHLAVSPLNSSEQDVRKGKTSSKTCLEAF